MEPKAGTCALCGQYMILTDEDCWHPWTVKKACPEEPDRGDYAAWNEWYAAGKRSGRPGREHFIERS